MINMDKKYIEDILNLVQSGTLSVEKAIKELEQLPYETINGYARIDHHRNLRRGVPEVIFGQGKTPDQLAEIFNHMADRSSQVLATRVSDALYSALDGRLPQDAVYDHQSKLLYLDRDPRRKRLEGIVVISAGTSDLPVAEEAAVTADLMGHSIQRVYDVGVAGLHRLLDQLDLLRSANVIVVTAGMEGALPSVVAGLVRVPVIGLPTSVGYGASFNGLSALLAMLNSCSNGIAVVNIDNGFGAGSLAAMINRLAHNHSIEGAG
jgi:pyridinium-3,5-biscarboxylic acid mononucleotide synthase